ncbi:hypothetical protein SAMN04488056_101319 [Cohaesibacter marisflavi]|uniref:DUF5330 domain-containing protein n=1 Tax=Cohaesibacter marisflavi TaxID=655353 RepID=A0A1I5A2J1_9HYPH|nr:DUF5330 domain-containing protein [Cohaesibacter marisflavi]SFN56597.1 hypothetical protein SAMN04488056_101319 [Cohaesibacter marisflavi]
MSFLIRAAFWLSLVILILPADRENTSDNANLSTSEALVAAQATLKDFTSFCSRQPEVCAAGEVAIENFSAKARYGAKQVYMYLDGDKDQTADTTTSAPENTLAMNEATLKQQELDRQALAEMVRNAD